MALWMLYALAPGLALCCAALLAEQAARQRRWPSRFIWLAAMVGSIVSPALGPAFPQLAPLQLPSSAAVASTVLAEAAPVISQVDAVAHPRGVPLARALWIALSLATVVALAGCAALIRHRARHWRRILIDGRETFVAPESGPAVFGWWCPRIVLPAWLASAPSRQRELALAHEQSHLDAHDPQLLGITLVLLAVMPWNPALWWQLCRMRQAIEVDCDGRVLGRGHDLLDYGEALLALGLRRSQRYGLMSASDSSRSLLERRIRIMSSQPNQWSHVTAGVMVGLALCTVAVAAELAPARDTAVTPSTPHASADLVAPPAPKAAHAPRNVRELPAPIAPHAPLTLSQLRALPAPPAPPAPSVPPAPPAPPAHVPALAAVAPLPPLPPIAARAPLAAVEREEADAADDPVESAKAEAEEAAERAAELKNDAEEADQAAREAMQDALEQQAQAEAAKREAEAAAAEAMARKQAAEAAAPSAQSSNRVN